MDTRSADLPRIDAPVLIVHGAEDRILPSESVSQRLPALAKDAPSGPGRARTAHHRVNRPDELDDALQALPGE
jgi:pimeloyl-ACP methyl ester carboxylesterase